MYSSSRDDGRGGGGVVIDGTRRAVGGLVRDGPGREVPRRVAGRVLDLAAVRGLDEPPFFPPPFFPPPFFAPPFFAVPGFSAEPDWSVPFGLLPPAAGAELALAAAGLVVPDFAEVPDLARDLLAAVLVVLARAAVARLAGLAGALAADDLLVADLLAADVRADDRVVRPAVAVARFAAGRRAGAADAAGLTADSEFAAEVRALAAVVIALVAVFTDCIAVDSVRADDVALVAAVVILVAAEVTLVAADDTVRAALAGVWPADEARVLRRAAARAGWRVPLVLRAVLRGPAARADLVVVLRADDLVLVD
ncbi:MAG TPA: hypothetical protein VK586_00535 [Streptosporangiaceae bacterium]|nr:hypothetical protein [Streptosporangiaceae bacterium]